MPEWQWHESGPRFQTEADCPKLEVCPEILDAIQQSLQHCDKSPTQEAEPYDHYRYDQSRKEVDRDLSALLR
jgi:hypothetical protein